MEHSRRTFLKRGAVGVAAAGAVAAVPAVLGSSSASAEPESNAPAHGGAFVAWVKDASTGRIAVLVGEKEMEFTDKRMAKRLAQVAAQAMKA